jgi:CRP/FNR family cyclic AMP-dependent transcriptional regulator
MLSTTNIAGRLAPRESRTPGVSTKLLRGVELLSALRENELAMLARAATHESFPRGSILSAAGRPSDAVYVLVCGRVKVFLKDVTGREMILRVLGPGDLIVEMDVFDDHPCSASIGALVTCEFIRIAKGDFTRCLAASFDLTMLVVRELERRLRDAEALIGSLALKNVRGRVLHLLRQAAEPVAGRMVVRTKFSHRDIARRIGSSRESVTHALKSLQSRGQVEVFRGRMIIRDDAVADPQ